MSSINSNTHDNTMSEAAPSLPPLQQQPPPPDPTKNNEQVVDINHAVTQAFANAAAAAEDDNKQQPPPPLPSIDPAIWENLLSQLRLQLRLMTPAERYEHCVEIQNLARMEVSSRSDFIANQLGGSGSSAAP